SARGAETGAEPASCKNSPSDRIVTRAFEEAEERARVKQFGPRPRNALDAFSEKWDRGEQRKASSGEPRVVIPARYPGLPGFSGRAGPMLQLLPVTRPACLDRVLSTVEGYYQAQPLGGEPSLIAVLGFLDRDPAEACLQEVAAWLVPGARLERDGALT